MKWAGSACPFESNAVSYTHLLGRDTGGGGNTDTMLLASYDVTNQKATVMSIPRDTMVNVSWDIKRINSVYNLSLIHICIERIERQWIEKTESIRRAGRRKRADPRSRRNRAA